MLDLDLMKADARERLTAKGFPTIVLSADQKAALVAAGQNPDPPMLPELVDAVLETIFDHLVAKLPLTKRAEVFDPGDPDPITGGIR